MTTTTGTSAALGVLHTLADGVYAYVQGDGGWCVSNAGLIAGPDLAIILDTAATERRARAWLQTVDELVADTPRIVVNTHSHGDHTFGNFLLPADVPIVAHRRARDEMAATGLALTQLWPDVDWGDVRVRLPTACIAESLTLHPGARAVEIRHLGVAHTTNDLIAWLPAERILFAADQVLSGCTPFYLFGSVLGAQATLREIERLDPLVVVPGHGAIGGPELIADTVAYVEWVVATGRDGLRNGETPLALARRAGPGPFPQWIDDERHVANFHRAYADLAGAAPGAPLDVKTAFDEMVACCEAGYPVCRA